ncbi:MAG TPA: PD-(D/E)XK nuclease family protein [Vicinamibacterales bacterium]|jgi:RecB family exonuclease|nr:PD-(D/E)XK nuclease family protein [Vicinamibacterales bacterium]
MQRRVLIRARGLASFRRALRTLALEGGPLAVRRRLLVVPTRASADLLRQTIEQEALSIAQPSLVLPDMLTRDEWLGRLFDALPPGRRWLSRTERLVLLERAARETLARRAIERPFHLRPGLIAAMLDFHDELRRRQRSVRRFARALFDELRGERGMDRGSEGLINQTRFLGFAFLAYARAVEASGGVDEHALRRLLLRTQPALPFDDLVVAVADHPADPRGLWPVDFDLVGRLTHLQHVRIVMTDEAHDAGFRERLETELPGIEEARAETVARAPVLVSHVAEPTGVPVAIARDREEELRDVARAIRRRAGAAGGVLAAPAAIVFHRPLPYLYLAQQILTDARVPYQAFDALPLAGEPYAAMLDLVMAMARTGGTREATIALLRSPLLRFEIDDRIVSPRDVSALDAILSERRATGDAASYPAEVEAYAAAREGRARVEIDRAQRAARAAVAAKAALDRHRSAPLASGQVDALAAFLRAHERPADGGADGDRPKRARAAVLSVLDDLAAAFARHDDGPRDHEDLAAIIHHAIEARTFMPRRGDGGVHLVDAVTARFGELDDVYLVGLVETDWAERQRRSFFYSSVLLKVLGWPQDDDQARAQQAAFRDVLHLARERTRLSAFQLEGDAIVALSPLVEMARRVPVVVDPPAAHVDLFPDEIWTTYAPPADLDPSVASWLTLRHDRPPLSDPAYSGYVDAQAPIAYSVSRVDRYVTCPFKYFAAHVLRLAEDRDVEIGLTPLERGTLLHTLFERFYQRWQTSGRGAITAAAIPEALSLFSQVMDEALASLPEADRVLEEMRLHGSMVAPGVAARVFELEAADPREVRERLIEEALEGTFTFPIHHGFSTRDIDIRGKADRIDVFADGALRVVDYKLGRMPHLETSVQVGVYAYCAQEKLAARDGRPHEIAGAMYLAFGDDRLEGRLRGATPAEVSSAVNAKASEFAEMVARIEEGRFPPDPRTPGECAWCGFAGVCRKEYRVEDEDEAAEPV